MFLAVAIFIIEAFVVFRLGYAYGLLHGGSAIVSTIRKILSPEEFKELDNKVATALKNHEFKSK